MFACGTQSIAILQPYTEDKLYYGFIVALGNWSPGTLKRVFVVHSLSPSDQTKLAELLIFQHFSPEIKHGTLSPLLSYL